MKNIENEFDEQVSRLFKANLESNPSSNDLMHAAIGIAGEAGELLDAIKKHWAYKKPLDLTNVIEELGDLEFYLEALRKKLELTRVQCLQANMDKLSRRYHKGVYTDQQAQERADKC